MKGLPPALLHRPRFAIVLSFPSLVPLLFLLFYRPLQIFSANFFFPTFVNHWQLLLPRKFNSFLCKSLGLHSPSIREAVGREEAKENSPAEGFYPPSWCLDLAWLYNSYSTPLMHSLTMWGVLFLRDKKVFALGRREKIEWKCFIFTWTTIILLTQDKVLTGFHC